MLLLGLLVLLVVVVGGRKGGREGGRRGGGVLQVVGVLMAGVGGGRDGGREGGGAVGGHGGGLLKLELDGSDLVQTVLPDGLRAREGREGGREGGKKEKKMSTLYCRWPTHLFVPSLPPSLPPYLQSVQLHHGLSNLKGLGGHAGVEDALPDRAHCRGRERKREGGGREDVSTWSFITQKTVDKKGGREGGRGGGREGGRGTYHRRISW